MPNRYQVFLSYNWEDKPAVREIWGRLRRRGIAAFFDDECVPSNPDWIPTLECGLQDSDSCALFYGEHGVGPTQELERKLALLMATDTWRRGRKFGIIPIRLPGAPEWTQLNLPPFLRLYEWIDFPSLTDGGALNRLVAAIPQEVPPPEDLDADPNSCPYVGMLPFGEDKSSIFTGRQQYLIHLAELLRSNTSPRFAAVLGASGSGKSSLLHAGLLPRLRSGRFGWDTRAWHLRVVRPGQCATDNLVSSVRSLLGEKLPPVDKPLRSTWLHDAGVALCGNQHDAPRLVVIVDQAEELFTSRPRGSGPQADEERREYVEQTWRPFLDNLRYAAEEPSGPVVVVMALRSDFLTQFENDPGLKGLISERRFRCLVTPLSEQQVRAAIEQPAVSRGLTVDPQLVQAVVDDYLLDPQGALPFLQEALCRVWAQRQRNELTLAAYQGLGEYGGFRGALSAHADEVLARLREQDDKKGTKAELARWLFLHLIRPATPGAPATKRRVPLNSRSLPGGSAGVELARSLAVYPGKLKSRLLVVDDDQSVQRAVGTSESGTVELAHDALVYGWNTLDDMLHDEKIRSFLAWRTKIEICMTPASSSTRKATVLPDPLLDEAKVLFGKGRSVSHCQDRPIPDVLSSSPAQVVMGGQMWEFVKAGLVARKKRKLRRVGILLAVAISLSGVLYVQDSETTLRSRVELGKNAMSIGAVLDSVQEFSEALRVLPFWRSGTSDRLRLSLALQQSLEPAQPPFPHDGPVNQVAFSPDGSNILARVNSDSLVLWDLERRTARTFKSKELFKHLAEITDAKFSLDGKYIAASSDRGGVAVLDLEKGTSFLLPCNSRVHRISFSTFGTHVAAACQDGVVRIWRVTRSPQSPVELEPANEGVRSKQLQVSFSDNDRYILSAGSSGLAVWDGKKAIEGKAVPLTLRSGEQVTDEVYAEFDSQGQFIVAASAGGSALYKLQEQNGAVEVHRFWQKSTMEALWAAFSPTETNGTSISVGVGPKGGVYFYPESPREKLGVSGPHRDQRVNFVCYSPRGDRAVTASDDKTAVLWDQKTGQPIATLPHNGKVLWAAFSKDGQRVVTAGEDAMVKVWNTGRVYVLPHKKPVSTNCWSDTSRLIATVTQEEYGPWVSIWDTGTGLLVTNRLFQTPDISDTIKSCEFGKDATNMTIRLRDGRTMGWELTGTQVPALESSGSSQPRSPLRSGKHTVTIEKGTKVVIWNKNRAKEPTCRVVNRTKIGYCDLSPEGRYLFVTCTDGTARLWDFTDVPKDELLRRAQALLATSASDRVKLSTLRQSRRDEEYQHEGSAPRAP